MRQLTSPDGLNYDRTNDMKPYFITRFFWENAQETFAVFPMRKRPDGTLVEQTFYLDNGRFKKVPHIAEFATEAEAKAFVAGRASK